MAAWEYRFNREGRSGPSPRSPNDYGKETIMNNLFISGMVSGKTTFREEAGGTPHMIFTIGVRAGKGYDYFRVSAWNRSALWAKEHITGGTLVAVHGRLQDRKSVV